MLALPPTAALVAAADALAQAMAPDAPLTTAPADQGAALADVIVATPRAVAAPLVGGSAVVAVAVAPAVADAADQAGGMVAGLVGPLAAAVQALGEVTGVALEAGVPEEVDAGGLVAAGAGVAAVHVLDGDVTLATLLVVAEQPAEQAEPHEFPTLVSDDGPTGRTKPFELLNDVEMGVTVELGRTRMLVREILALAPGSVVELDRAAGSPVDVLVNGTLIARGEVVVIDEEFGIRITEIVGYADEVRRAVR